jgi:Uma2 family endonuclease
MSSTSARRHRSDDDPTHYPVDDGMGEGTLHREIGLVIQPLVRRYLATRRVRAYVGSNQFIYWVQHEPTTSVAPDLYVLPGVAPDAAFGCWKVWETGVVPTFVLEVVSKYPIKDYERAPVRYAELGVSELVIFDPQPEQRAEGVRWQVYRRTSQREFVCVAATDVDRIRSRVLGCWLRAVGDGNEIRARIATGPSGDALFPTDVEAERAALKAERAALEAERAALRSAEDALTTARAALEAERTRRPTPRRRKR